MLAEILQEYHQFKVWQTELVPLYLKAGVRYFPQLHPGLALFDLATFTNVRLLDATASAGSLSSKVLKDVQKSVVLETSCAALRSAAKTFEAQDKVTLSATALWDIPKASFDLVCLCPATDKGSARVKAELLASHAVLVKGGLAYVLMHKDQGAKSYEKWLKTIFASCEVVAKKGGWRLVKACKKETSLPEVEPIRFKASGLNLQAQPGVYAAGKLDPGTAFLLETYPMEQLASKRVLDLGCGYGLLALKASLAGAEVTAIDDDVLAVKSSYQNARTYGLDIRCLHSDVDSELKESAFDVVLSNPPFHVGKQVKLSVPQAFIAAAHARLKEKGALVLVANKALAYEALLEHFASYELLAMNDTFKVLKAIK